MIYSTFEKNSLKFLQGKHSLVRVVRIIHKALSCILKQWKIVFQGRNRHTYWESYPQVGDILLGPDYENLEDSDVDILNIAVLSRSVHYPAATLHQALF